MANTSTSKAKAAIPGFADTQLRLVLEPSYKGADMRGPDMRRWPKVLSYGGGLDSFAMLLTAIKRGELPDVVIFMDTGHPLDPGEWPGTYRHIDEVVRPLCARHGIEFVTLDHTNYPVRGGTKGEARSLFAWFEARKAMPMAGPGRSCTTIAKVERFERWANDRYPGLDIEVWIGFEAGEEERAAKDPNTGRKEPKRIKKGAKPRARRHNRFPLMEMNLCRCRCEELVRESGYPVPRKSACVFCPFGSLGDWKTLATELPETFARIAKMEADRPLTKPKDKDGVRVHDGLKLSIMGFRKGKGTPLPMFIEKPYTPKIIPCAICGAANRATKATACGYLDDNTRTHSEAA
jgi:hypothetical protein